VNTRLKEVADELEKAIVGKRAVIERLITAVLSNGHVLLDDVPGVGKTTLAISVSRVLGLQYNRIQFTPDVLPSDITGFSIYRKETGTLEYMPGAADGANILLADEINRTSSKTQSALLEAMEEYQVTVDGKTHAMENPFIVIATQNNVGAAGTQILPFAQLDRFLMRLSIGYPDLESQMEIIRSRQRSNPVNDIRQIVSKDDILKMQEEVTGVTVKDGVIEYIAKLAEASRNDAMIELGISPRGALFISKVSKAKAYFDGRDYVIPEDVREIFADVCAHRIIISREAKSRQVTAGQIAEDLLKKVKPPDSLI
jgi:MoxR-like ATPase